MEKNLDKTLSEIKNAFVVINKHLFGGSLPEPVLVVQASHRAKMGAMGWFTLGKLWKNKETGECFNEITICSETLTQSLHTILEVLVHEMVHLYCMVNNIKDCSGRGGYHNKLFKQNAEKFLLKTNDIPDKRYGYGYTSPTAELIEFLEMIGIDEEAFNLGETAPYLPPKRYTMHIYDCKCGASFKTSANLAAIQCAVCGKEFVKREQNLKVS